MNLYVVNVPQCLYLSPIETEGTVLEELAFGDVVLVDEKLFFEDNGLKSWLAIARGRIGFLCAVVSTQPIGLKPI